MLLYFYDLKIPLKDYNSFKRKFYYRLKHSKLGAIPWKTKSVLLINDELEEEADRFFEEWKPHIIVYKARVEEILKV